MTRDVLGPFSLGVVGLYQPKTVMLLEVISFL
jgi:hypothetical protein